jgi:hypothetical protein
LGLLGSEKGGGGDLSERLAIALMGAAVFVLGDLF